MDDDNDVRAVELSTIAAIYPEELRIDELDPYSFTIELPVSLSKPLIVRFPAASEATAPVPQDPTIGSALAAADSQELTNLPSLEIHIALPVGYPEMKPPVVRVSTSPPWLSAEILQRLEGSAERLWNEMGRDQVVFGYIDDVQQAADGVFGLVGQDNTLEVAPEHKIAILDYDSMAKRRAFERGTFDCGICLDPKKGAVCHRMLDCGHVFCRQCLQDFYNNAITEGDVNSVRCLEPNCAEERNKAREAEGSKRKKKPATFISPSELLQIPLDEGMVKRYVTLKHKLELESDKNTVYCPRSWCQGAARSSKHKKPEGLDFAQGSDDESDSEDKAADGQPNKFRSQDLLAICEDCGFAFCSRCGQSWHGEFKYCIPKERKEAITAEEQASLEYLRQHTTPCPTCAAPCQKTHGCNHMRCFRCETHFCYLCSAWLDPSNPYRHFNVATDGSVNGCYMRLWELEGGDGDDVGIGYGGGAGPRVAVGPPAPEGQHPEVILQAGNEPENEQADGAGAGAGDEEALRAAAQQAPMRQVGQGAAQGERRVGVAREGPLVLRIEDNAAPARGRGRQDGPAPGNHQPVPVAGGRGGRGGPGVMNAGRRGGGGGGGGGAGRAGRAGANHRPNNNNNNNNHHQQRQRGQGQNAQANANQQINRHGDQARPVEDDGLPPDAQLGQLNQLDEAWVRHFVQLALNDEEHLVEWDSDDED